MPFKKNTAQKLLSSLLAAGLMLSVGGCAWWNKIKFQDAQYWQRANVRDSFRMDNAGKQQWLNRDIAACVADMRELQRAGELRDAIPGPGGSNADEATLADWDTPERDGYLLMEHYDYPDFEACMNARGWRRIQDVPFPTAEKSQETYLESRGITPPSKQPKEKEPPGNSYLNL